MEFLIKLMIQLPPLLMALTFHEFSHGYIAYKLGDDTAKRQGRLTLNPIAHLDIIGAIMLFIANIGWAKPVPINPYNFKDFKRGTALTAAAGPAANAIIAIIFAVIYNMIFKYAPNEMYMNSQWYAFAEIFVKYTIFINLALGIFNLIPIPPMDGSKILGGFLSDNAYFKYTAKEKEGVGILMLLFMVSFVFNLNIIGWIIMPPLNFLMKLMIGSSF